MAAPTLTDDQLAEILDAKSYADMQETAARFGIDLEAGVMDWEVGVEPWMLAELADHRRTLRDSERKDGMTLGEREAADRLVAQANGDLLPEQDAALPGATPTSTSSNTPRGRTRRSTTSRSSSTRSRRPGWARRRRRRS